MKHQSGQASSLIFLFIIAHAEVAQAREVSMSNLVKVLRLRRGAPCPVSTMCRSRWGFCGNSAAYCGDGCQAGPCRSPTSTTKVATTMATSTSSTNTDKAIITADRFRCAFGNLNETTRSARLDGLQRSGWKAQNADEAAVFLAHVYHETDGLKTLTEYCAPSKFRRHAMYCLAKTTVVSLLR